MDDLTLERYGRLTEADLAAELAGYRAGPSSIRARRIVLCGTDDLGVLERGGALPGSRRARRLLEVIRRAAA